MGLFGSEQTVYLKYTIYLADKAKVALLAGTGDVQRVANMAPQQAATVYAAPLQNSNLPMVSPCIRSEYIKPLPTPNTNFPYDLASFDVSSGGFLGFGGSTIHYIWRGLFAYAPSVASETGLPISPVAARRWIDGFELPLAGDFCSREASRSLPGYGWKFDSVVTITHTHTPIEGGGAATRRQWERFYFRIRVLPTGSKSRLWRVRGFSSANAGAALDILPDGTLLVSQIDASNVETQLGVAGVGVKIGVDVWHKFDLVYSFFDPNALNNPSGFLAVYLDGISDMSAAALPSNQFIGSSELGGGPNTGLCWDVDDWIGADPPTNALVGAPSPPPWWDPIAHRPTGRDWNNGSRILPIGADGFGSDNSGTWVGDWRLTRQRPIGNNPQQFVTAGTNGVRLTVKTDAGRVLDQEINALGLVAISVAAYQKRTASPEGALGFRLGALTTVPAIVGGAALQWNRTLYSFTTFGPVSSVASGGPLTGLELIHDSGNGESLQTLMAEAELVGCFGKEDIVAQPTDGTTQPPTVAPTIGIHNAPYYRTVWAKKGFPPVSPVLIVAGTYVGNGTFQDLGFKAPIHFFWTRPLTGGAGGFQWFSSMNAAHQGGGEAHWPDGIISVEMDPLFVAGDDSAYAGNPAPLPAPSVTVQAACDLANQLAYGFAKHTAAYWTAQGYLSDPAFFFGRMLGNGAGGTDIAKYGLYAVPPSPWNTVPAQQQCLVRLAGTNANSNANGVTYQYLAIGDPGERFFSAGALKVANQAIDIISSLDDGKFLPNAAFLLQERNGASLVVHLFYKGVGHVAGALTQFQGTALATGLQFGTGTLLSSAALMSGSANQIPYLAIRRDDHSADPGMPRVMSLASYTGDGAASRTVSLAPITGRYPLWALVVPHSGGQVPIYRDPSHTGTTSTEFPSTANATNGITSGGLDSISVGTPLNGAGVLYDVFVIPGDVFSGNNGFSINGEFIPVDPTAGDGTQFDPTPASPEDNNAPPDGGTGPSTPPVVPPSGPPDLTGDCASASLVPINQALSHIGVSIRVDDILLEQTQAATIARLHYQDDVDTTLRAFPWPFATRYADLVLVAGSSSVRANGDWQYAYRAPAGMLFARRILDPTWRGRKYDPQPIPFRVGSDDTGPLIYTNWINADGLTATLEYTIRPVCAASAGDALFRSALAWKLAHSFAPVLAKDEKKVLMCWQMYRQLVGTATTVGSQEQQQEKPGGPDWIDGRDDAPDWLKGR